MPNAHYSLPLAHRPDFAISAARQNRIEAKKLGEMDYDNPRQVEKARLAITDMGLWDSVVDSLFYHGSKAAALDLLATKVLCEQAIQWENDPNRSGGRKALDHLNADNLRQAQAALVPLLSAEGAKTMVANHKHVDGGIRFWLATKSNAVNDMLSMVLPYQDAAALLTQAGSFGEAAKAHRALAKSLSKSGDDAQGAKAYSEAVKAHQKAREFVEAADAKGKEATAWQAANHHFEATKARSEAHLMAEAYAKVAEQQKTQAHDLATKRTLCTQIKKGGEQQSLNKEATLYEQSAISWRATATAWQAAGWLDQAAMSKRKEAQAWAAYAEIDGNIEPYQRNAKGNAQEEAIAKSAAAYKEEAVLWEKMGQPDKAAAALRERVTVLGPFTRPDHGETAATETSAAGAEHDVPNEDVDTAMNELATELAPDPELYGTGAADSHDEGHLLRIPPETLELIAGNLNAGSLLTVREVCRTLEEASSVRAAFVTASACASMDKEPAEGLEKALLLISSLPASQQLAPLQALANRLRRTEVDRAYAFDALAAAAQGLAPTSKREFLATLVSQIHSQWHREKRIAVWDMCFDEITRINASMSDRRGEGMPALALSVQYIEPNQEDRRERAERILEAVLQLDDGRWKASALSELAIPMRRNFGDEGVHAVSETVLSAVLNLDNNYPEKAVALRAVAWAVGDHPDPPAALEAVLPPILGLPPAGQADALHGVIGALGYLPLADVHDPFLRAFEAVVSLPPNTPEKPGLLDGVLKLIPCVPAAESAAVFHAAAGAIAEFSPGVNSARTLLNFLCAFDLLPVANVPAALSQILPTIQKHVAAGRLNPELLFYHVGLDNILGQLPPAKQFEIREALRTAARSHVGQTAGRVVWG